MHGFEKRWRGYGEMEHHLRMTILRYFAAHGRAPTVEILSELAAISTGQTRHLLARLRDLDLVIFDGDRDRITGAYPFADRDTGHRVLLGNVVANAMCAIDALGAGAMCERDALIVSRCRVCEAPIRIETEAHGAVLDWCDPGRTVVWSDLGYANGCGATSSCTRTEFFCGDEHLRAWRDVRHPSTAGDRLTIPEAHEVGMAIFTPYLARVEHRSPEIEGKAS